MSAPASSKPPFRLESKHAVAIVALICVFVLEGVALATGHDGVMFAGTLAFAGSVIGAVYGLKIVRQGGS